MGAAGDTSPNSLTPIDRLTEHLFKAAVPSDLEITRFDTRTMPRPLP